MEEYKNKNYFANKVCPKNCLSDCNECALIVKKLNVLNIIFKKCVDVELIKKCEKPEDYNTTLCYHDLTRNEFFQIKEVEEVL